MKARNAPVRYDVEAYRGDTLSLPFQARDAGGAVDLSDYEIAAQVRSTRLSTTVVASFLPVIENATQGLYSLVMSAATIAALPCGELPTDAASQYVWDVQLKSPTGVVKTTHAGTFVVSADVSRSA